MSLESAFKVAKNDIKEYFFYFADNGKKTYHSFSTAINKMSLWLACLLSFKNFFFLASSKKRIKLEVLVLISVKTY